MSTAPADLEADAAEPTSRVWPEVSVVALIGVLLPLLAHLPVLWNYAWGLYTLPHYGYILTLPIFAAVLAYSRVRHLGELAPGNHWVAAAWFFPAVFLLAASSVFDSPWLGGISSVWVVIATGYAIGGGPLVVALLPSWAMLCLAIRLPFLADERLVQWLQSVAAERASALLHAIGQPHILDGNVVETPVKRYLVEEACSGVQSLFAITTCTLFYVLWTRMAWWRAILIMAVSWFWVWTANVARIVLVTYLNSSLGWKVDDGPWHDAMGVALFATTLLLILSSAHLIWFFLPYGIFGGRDGNEESAEAERNRGPWTKLPKLRSTIFSSPAFQVVYVLMLLFVWIPQWRVPFPTASPAQLSQLGKNFAPADFEGWRLKGGTFETENGKSDSRQEKPIARRDDSQWGAFSQNWIYEKNSKEVTVSLDYPFLGWHDLTTCYAVDGWKIDKRVVASVPQSTKVPDAIGADERYVQTSMRRPEKNDYGFVAYQCFNDRRVPIPVPEFNIFSMLGDRLKAYRRRLLTLGASGSGLNDQVRTYQLQVLMQDHDELLDKDRAEAERLFVHFRVLLDRKLAAADNGGAP